MVCRAVIFDYIGTLVNCRNYTMEASKLNLHRTLVTEGFDVAKDRFLDAYDLAHEKYRKVRYGQLREVTNAVWVAEALGNLGFEVSTEDCHIKAALNVFFQDFIDTLELREGAKKLLRRNQSTGQSRFNLKLHLRASHLQEPKKDGNKRIFQYCCCFGRGRLAKTQRTTYSKQALNRLQIQACEAVYIGDSPNEDIKGAKQAGLKTVFVPSQFNKLKDLRESKQKPDNIAKDLKAIYQSLSQILSL